jgi:hypothetical protein
MARDVFGDEQPMGDSSTSGWASPPSNSPPGPIAPSHPASPPSAASPTQPQSPSPTIMAGFGPSTAGASAGNRQVNAPVGLLGIAGVCVLAALTLGGLANGRPLLAATGWVLGGFVAVGVLAWFTLTDSVRRADAWYTAASLPGVLRSSLLLGAVLAVALNAYQFADWKSRQ